MAYAPTGRWSIRAGFGIFYVQDIGDAIYDASRNPAGRDGSFIDANARTITSESPWAAEINNPLCPGWGGVCELRPQIVSPYMGNRTPYIEQWIFNVQRQLTQSLLLEVGYMGNAGHKLGRNMIANQGVYKTGPTDTSTTASRSPWPTYGVFNTSWNQTNSNYHALSGKLTQRPVKGLTYTVAFTWGHAIDFGSALRTNGGDSLWPVDSYQLFRMHGDSQFNQFRRFVASYVYDLPFGTGRTWLHQGVMGRILGPWQLGGILTLADGTSTIGTTLSDPASLGILNDFPFATGISPFPANRTASNFFNPAAFDFTNINLSWEPGNEGRGVLFTPGTQIFNASLERGLKIRENHIVSFRFEAFNALNHPNWNTPSNDTRAMSTFGIVTSAKTMRQLQVALRYNF